MLQHYWRLIWNRKWENSLILLELVAVFLVVFFIASMFTHYWNLSRQPLGFDYRDTYAMSLYPTGNWEESDGKQVNDLLAALRARPDVQFAHIVRIPPYRNWQWTRTLRVYGEEINGVMVNDVSGSAPQDIGMTLLEGRWFEPDDVGAEEHRVLINRYMRDNLFRGREAIGQDIANVNPDDYDGPQEVIRVIGVVEDFRHQGEFSEMTPYVLGVRDPNKLAERVNSVLIRLHDGPSVEKEKDLQRMAESFGPNWRVTLSTLERARTAYLRNESTVLITAGIVAGFVLLMVAFGMFGVLWQNVTRRTSELGLRRAVGASRKHVYRQIVWETGFLVILAVIVGVIVAVQFPLLGSFRTIHWFSATGGIMLSATVLVGISLLCALYPAILASRKAPAEALHYE